MASKVKTGRGKSTSVPNPQRADFLHGSWPASARAPAPPRIKPGAGSSRNYGKDDQEDAPLPFGNTSLTGRS